MHPCPGEETKFKALSREVNRNVTTDLSKIVSLLSSEEWAHVNQGYELYRSLADPDLGRNCSVSCSAISNGQAVHRHRYASMSEPGRTISSSW